MRDSILRWLTGSHGVHAETLMVVVGALAGFAPQNAAFRSIGPPDTPSNGAIYAAEVRRGGAEGRPRPDLPDVVEMFDQISKSVGTPDFGPSLRKTCSIRGSCCR